MEPHDRRRRQWFALDVSFFTKPFAEHLNERFHAEGLLAWIAYLAACKRNPTPGEFSYTSEPEGWTRLGLDMLEPPPGFTLAEFFAFTGRQKQTKREKSGRMIHVVCRDWEAWQYPSVRVRSEEKPVSPNGKAPAGVAAIGLTLSQLGEVDIERLTKIVRDFPGKAHQAEAVSMVDWTLKHKIKRKDVVRAYCNWLMTAPDSDVNPYVAGDPTISIDEQVLP